MTLSRSTPATSALVPAGRTERLVLGLGLPLGFLALWSVASAQGWLDPRIYPSPLAVWHRFAELWAMGEIGSNLMASVLRMLAGFVVGGLAGVVLGAFLGLSRLADRLIGPSFHAFKQVAQMAWVPLICMWFGFAETSKIIFVALSAFIPVTLNATLGFNSVPKAYREVARAFRLGLFALVRRLYLPAALPSLLTGVKLGLIYAWLGAIGAEYFMSTGAGIGGLLVAGAERFDMAQVLVGIVLMGLVGSALNFAGIRLAALVK